MTEGLARNLVSTGVSPDPGSAISGRRQPSACRPVSVIPIALYFDDDSTGADQEAFGCVRCEVIAG